MSDVPTSKYFPADPEFSHFYRCRACLRLVAGVGLDAHATRHEIEPAP